MLKIYQKAVDTAPELVNLEERNYKDAGFVGTLSFDNASNNVFNIKITGQASKTLHWKGFIKQLNH